MSRVAVDYGPVVAFQWVSFRPHCDHLVYMQRDKNSRLASTVTCQTCGSTWVIVEPYGPGKTIEVEYP